MCIYVITLISNDIIVIILGLPCCCCVVSSVETFNFNLCTGAGPTTFRNQFSKVISNLISKIISDFYTSLIEIMVINFARLLNDQLWEIEW